MTKAEANFIHARRRAAERYGLDFDQPLVEKIVARIQAATGASKHEQQLLGVHHYYSTSNRRSVWQVKIGQVWVRVVYDKDHKNLVTVI